MQNRDIIMCDNMLVSTELHRTFTSPISVIILSIRPLPSQHNTYPLASINKDLAEVIMDAGYHGDSKE